MDLFVYGSLQSTSLMQAVAGGSLGSPVQAELDGFEVLCVTGAVVPCIQAMPDATTLGMLWRDLSSTQIARLDLYEGAFGFGLRDAIIRTPSGTQTAKTYHPPPDIAADQPWSLAEWEAVHQSAAILAAQELFRHDPLPQMHQLRRMWPMMEARAWAIHRAAAAPSTIRYAPREGDVQADCVGPPLGNFFRLQAVTVQHRRFDGNRSAALPREVFVGVDATIVLPYDPVKDRVVLVEQMRLGPVMRHDPNPWMLEPVAGIVDARETPEAAARRETQEEAGLVLHHLEPAGSYYPSPGATTDYFYTYVGLCDIPQDGPYLGGLDHEAEDLRLHPMQFQAAMERVQSGEIATGPLHHLMYWLSHHRDRMRAMG